MDLVAVRDRPRLREPDPAAPSSRARRRLSTKFGEAAVAEDGRRFALTRKVTPEADYSPRGIPGDTSPCTLAKYMETYNNHALLNV